MLALGKMGIADQLKPRIKWVGNRAAVLQSVSKGESEIALGPYLSDMRGSNFDVVGALPPEASTPVDITGFLSTSVKDPKAAQGAPDLSLIARSGAYLRGREDIPRSLRNFAVARLPRSVRRATA